MVWEGNRQATVEWWEDKRQRFELVTSQLVLDECRRGDATLAVARLALLTDLPALPTTPEVEALATALRRPTGLPEHATADTTHVACAAVFAADYLITWNCKHLANAALARRIAATCVAAGYRPPLICTPWMLSEVNP